MPVNMLRPRPTHKSTPSSKRHAAETRKPEALRPTYPVASAASIKSAVNSRTILGWGDASMALGSGTTNLMMVGKDAAGKRSRCPLLKIASEPDWIHAEGRLRVNS